MLVPGKPDPLSDPDIVPPERVAENATGRYPPAVSVSSTSELIREPEIDTPYDVEFTTIAPLPLTA